MADIIYKDLSKDGPVEEVRELCNALMKHQAEQGKIGVDILESMDFDNRLKPSFEEAQYRFLCVAYDGGKTVGYVFCDAANIPDAETLNKFSGNDVWEEHFPDGQEGLYPSDMKTPVVVAHLNNLYVLPEYRDKKIGAELTKKAMGWMKSVPGVNRLFVHVSNGNDPGPFYERYGFKFSHYVWGGFIECYSQEV